MPKSIKQSNPIVAGVELTKEHYPKIRELALANLQGTEAQAQSFLAKLGGRKGVEKSMLKMWEMDLQRKNTLLPDG